MTVAVEIPCFMFGQALNCGDIKPANKVPNPLLILIFLVDKEKQPSDTKPCYIILRYNADMKEKKMK